MIYPEFRPRPSRREMLKMAAGATISCVMLILVTFTLALVVTTGAIESMSRNSDEIYRLAESPSRFVVNFTLLVLGGMVSAWGLIFFIRQVKQLRREAAEAGGWGS